MATKGTKYSDVNFSVPAGADPLGIGVPDLGRSSYDPIESIRHGWETSRQERLIKGQQRREDYQTFVKNIPTYESVNKNVAAQLKQGWDQVQRYAEQKMKTGEWFPMAKTPEGENVQIEMNRQMDKLAETGAAYELMLPKLKAADEFMRNPANYNKFYQDISRQRYNAAANAPDVTGMSNALIRPIVAMKPKPVDLLQEVAGRMETYMPPETVQKILENWDHQTNKLMVDTIEGVDPEMVRKSMLKVYDDLQASGYEEFARSITEGYDRAPKSEKMADGDIPIDEKAWFVGRYVPGYADKMTRKYVAATKDADKGLSLADAIPRDNAGNFVAAPETREFAPATDTKSAQAPTYYHSKSSVPLDSYFQKSFNMTMPANAVDAETGFAAPAGRSALVAVDTALVLPSAKNDITVTVNGVAKTYGAGEKIPFDAQNQLIKENRGGEMEDKGYITFKVDYTKMGTDVADIWKGTPMEDFIGRGLTSITNTIIAPYDEAKRYLKAQAQEQGLDFSELDNYMTWAINQNNLKGIIPEAGMTDEQIQAELESIYGIK